MISENYKLIEVIDKSTEKMFLYGTFHIYRNDNNWIPPLDSDVKNHFNANKNHLLKDGMAKRWIVVDDNFKVLGRIAAFFNLEKSKAHEQPTGGIGFYESINNLEISALLFNTSINWLKEFGIEAVDGPISLGEKNSHWGLLIKGYVQQMYGMHYHPKYYKDLFENFGFQLYYKQFTYRIEQKNVSERVFKVGRWVDKKQRFTARHFVESEKINFSRDLSEAYNNIWSSFKNDFTPTTGGGVQKMLDDAKFVLDPKLVWVIYDKKRPIALALIIPDVNQIIKRVDGKLSFINMVKLLYYKKKKMITRVRSIAIGVDPEYQRQGVEAYIFYKINKFLDKSQYKEIEFSWIGDFNTKMHSTIKSIGANKVSTHVTYRYLFDREKEFVRYPIDD